jgi:hypothetical protein
MKLKMGDARFGMQLAYYRIIECRQSMFVVKWSRLLCQTVESRLTWLDSAV